MAEQQTYAEKRGIRPNQVWADRRKPSSLVKVVDSQSGGVDFEMRTGKMAYLSTADFLAKFKPTASTWPGTKHVPDQGTVASTRWPSAHALLAKCARALRWIREEGLAASRPDVAADFADGLLADVAELRHVLYKAAAEAGLPGYAARLNHLEASPVERHRAAPAKPEPSSVPQSGTVSARTRAALFTKTRAAVLGLYLLDPHARFHVREAVRRLRMGQGTVQKEIGALWKAGLLVQHREGQRLAYQANTASEAFQPLAMLLAGAVRGSSRSVRDA